MKLKSLTLFTLLELAFLGLVALGVWLELESGSVPLERWAAIVFWGIAAVLLTYIASYVPRLFR